MKVLTTDILSKLITPSPRLPWITDWLLDEVWSVERFKSTSPEKYLTEGENKVHALEELLAASANRFYNELTAAAAQTKKLSERVPPDTAIIVFDGASIREMPLFIKQARQSGYQILKRSFSFAALPSNTTDFIEQRLLGKSVAPKTLPRRKELKERGIKAFYFHDAISTNHITCAGNEQLLLWSSFPDVTYQDSESRFARHFAEMQKLYGTVWKNTVMQIPPDRRILITSDHGYIFFGTGFDSLRPDTEKACEILNQNRSRVFPPDEELPEKSTSKDLQIFPDRRLAMLRGRTKNRPRGPAANRVYRHGGLSLMEMLVPWIILSGPELK